MAEFLCLSPAFGGSSVMRHFIEWNLDKEYAGGARYGMNMEYDNVKSNKSRRVKHSHMIGLT